MLVSIGEILVDIFKDGNNITTLPGGAPFNVACNAKLYTKDVYFVGAVGNDSNGKLLLDCANKVGFVKDGIKVLEDRETSKAIVTLENGERSFRFERDLGADYVLSLDDIDFSIIKEGDIVHIGSLMLSHEEGRNFFDELNMDVEIIVPKNLILTIEMTYSQVVILLKKFSKKP